MNPLLIRVLSGIAALAALFCSYYFWRENGLLAMTTIVVSIGCYELSRILFHHCKVKSALLQPLYVSSLIGGFLALVFLPKLGIALFSSIVVFYLLILFWHLRAVSDSQQMLSEVSLAVLGFFYVPVLTQFAGRILIEPQGILWFSFLLAITFFGDTFAYFIGKAFGKNKILPHISPKKTIAGSVGGLIGSMIAASLMFNWVEMHVVWTLPFIGLIVGMFAQLGDFFESLLKRSAQMKDSGRILPGHGGALDRIDGVIFACPVFYFFLGWLSGN